MSYIINPQLIVVLGFSKYQIKLRWLISVVNLRSGPTWEMGLWPYGRVTWLGQWILPMCVLPFPGLRSQLCKRQEVSWAQAFITLFFLTVDTLCAATSGSCPYDSPSWRNYPLNCGLNGTFPSSVAFGRRNWYTT